MCLNRRQNEHQFPLCGEKKKKSWSFRRKIKGKEERSKSSFSRLGGTHSPVKTQSWHEKNCIERNKQFHSAASCFETLILEDLWRRNKFFLLHILLNFLHFSTDASPQSSKVECAVIIRPLAEADAAVALCSDKPASGRRSPACNTFVTVSPRHMSEPHTNEDWNICFRLSASEKSIVHPYSAVFCLNLKNLQWGVNASQ